MSAPKIELDGLRRDNPIDAATDPDPSSATPLHRVTVATAQPIRDIHADPLIWAPYEQKQMVARKVRVYKGVTGWEFSCPTCGRFGWARYQFCHALAAAVEHVNLHQLGRGGAL